LPSETQPNWKEQFGRVVIEAMACGTPVVGSDSGAIPELIKSTIGGLIFHEGDGKELADRLHSCIHDSTFRESLGKNGGSEVVTTYTHQSLAERFAETVTGSLSSF